ncbi:histidine kinase [Metabacillus herbersteinensis]|uniref:histidine kinase n=1 Tax=Metabacillus herbersteinensis TaxID=283816 RepID=A0ABV6GC53_9BACI
MSLNLNKIYPVIVIVCIVLSIYYTFLCIEHPYVGATVVIEDDSLIVDEIEPKTWAAEVGLEQGDKLIEINDNDPYLHYPSIGFGQLEQVQHLIIERNGQNLEYFVSDTLITHQNLFMLIIPLTSFLLCLFCSYFVYKSNKRLNLASAFLLVCFLFTIAMAYLSGSGSARGDLFSRYLNLSLFLLVPVLYMHFIYQYFLESGKKLFSKKFIQVGYILVLFNILGEITQDIFQFSYIFNKLSNLISFFILIILTFVLKFSGLRKVKYSEQAYFVKIIIITNILSFSPFVFLYILPYIILNKYIFPPTFLASFILLIPFSLVYQFLATKIYDIEFILGRLRYYALLAVIPTFIFVGIMLAIKESNPTFYPIKLSIFIYLSMLLVFYVKEIFDFRFRLKRFSEKYNYQDSIFKYTQSISKFNNLDQVVTELKQVITDVLIVSRAYLIEVDKQKRILSVDVHAKEADHSPYEKEVKNVTAEIGKIIEVDRGFLLNVGETEDRSYVLLCLSVLNTPKLTRDEMSWLKTLSFYTNVSVENFLKIEELMDHLQKIEREGTNPAWLTKLLFSIEEKQRSNLAKDLHDSVLQDLVSLKRQCELALTELDSAPYELKEQLHEMNSNMTKIIKTTRETCQELRPQLLYDLGLVKALNKLVAQYQEYVAFTLRLNTGNFNVNIDIDTQLNLYRIVQELLTNAYKHSEAKQVLIMLVCIKDKIVLHYEDNGVGFDQDDIYSSTEKMGLSGISERVKSLKGTIQIETSKGGGFKVVIEI